jgi:hypothetical protein
MKVPRALESHEVALTLQSPFLLSASKAAKKTWLQSLSFCLSLFLFL